MTIKEALKAAAMNGVKLTLTGLPAIRKTLPKTKMGALVDEYHDIREVRLALTKVMEAIKAEEQRILDHIIENVSVDEGGCVGRNYKAIVVRDSKPVVEDWDALYKYITKHKAFDLLNKALNVGAVKERWEADKAVSGVGSFAVKKLSVTKVR